jgi:hypothetical protein
MIMRISSITGLIIRGSASPLFKVPGLSSYAGMNLTVWKTKSSEIAGTEMLHFRRDRTL